MMKADTFQSRRDSARDAKQKLLESFRTAVNDPAAEQRKAERQAIVQARDARMAMKAAEERRIAAEKLAEEQRLAAEKEAAAAAAEAERQAARPKVINAAKYALAARVIADMKPRNHDRDQSRKSA
ncbi:DUF6481 family protein [Hansschlegelia plantiphila]|uniref:Uncharacterized protein n=1 Tax=Hansschlegelia plantiphila TaxID=374655 RepID=A0A9W6J0X6_9HYPH|nr:DUF6481 family protein [Hansschlegelia plantiphila]GLK67399.1 hypothetical protein GCM10008179_10370 [Hansschlegelia plantiphila]